MGSASKKCRTHRKGEVGGEEPILIAPRRTMADHGTRAVGTLQTNSRSASQTSVSLGAGKTRGRKVKVRTVPWK